MSCYMLKHLKLKIPVVNPRSKSYFLIYFFTMCSNVGFNVFELRSILLKLNAFVVQSFEEFLELKQELITNKSTFLCDRIGRAKEVLNSIPLHAFSFELRHHSSRWKKKRRNSYPNQNDSPADLILRGYLRKTHISRQTHQNASYLQSSSERPSKSKRNTVLLVKRTRDKTRRY